jgi:hypothetical protein
MRTFMLGYPLRAFALAAAFVFLCAAPPALAANFDGSWNMQVVTTKGHCGKIPVGLGIKAGHMFATGGSFVFHPIQINGRVSASGQTTLVGVAGPRIAHGTGRFSRSYGRGIWSGTGPSGVCSGIWNAWRA